MLSMTSICSSDSYQQMLIMTSICSAASYLKKLQMLITDEHLLVRRLPGN
jgi:hypothetical protein